MKQAVTRAKQAVILSLNGVKGKDLLFLLNCITTPAKAQKQILRCAQDDKH
jgi:hypothetical protein